MLQRISIKNLALVRDAELDFSENLNVLSGETGAGKSIIVDALMLLLGGKYDKTMLSYGESSGYVEGCFVFEDAAKTSFLEDYGIEPDEELIVFRKFTSDGKNDVRLNGRSVTVKTLKAVMSKFVDICGQNEYQVLGNKNEHAAILDSYIGEEGEKLLEKLSALYSGYKDLIAKAAAIGNAEQRLQRLDLLAYQIGEIEDAKINDGEEEELSDFRARALSSEKLKNALSISQDALSSDGGALDKIYEALHSLSSISKISACYGELEERLNSLAVEAEDIAQTAGDMLSDVDFDEEDLEKAENRLQLLRNIKRKYGDLGDLPEKLRKMKDEYTLLSDGDAEYEDLMLRAEKTLKEAYSLSAELSSVRKAGARRLADDVKNELSALGMGNSEFSVSFADFPSEDDFKRYFTAKGADDVEFLLSPNPGQPLLPLAKIISGGEMSRFMLALKVVSSRYGGVQTMIFDEIDTGISGRTGREVAKKLASISRNSQVFCVTHLPQIASMADCQYFIEKTTDGYTTSTGVRKLDREGMIDEITRLSGAGDVTENARKTAEELKKWSDDYKKELESKR